MTGSFSDKLRLIISVIIVSPIFIVGVIYIVIGYPIHVLTGKYISLLFSRPGRYNFTTGKKRRQ